MNSERKGCGLIAIPIGLIIFFGAFFVVWSNEGRVDLSVLAEESIPVTGDSFSPENDGKLVALSGTIESDSLLGDDPYLKPVSAIQLVRNAEMYAWDESGDEEDGYSYRKVWTSSPENSDNFDRPAGHNNPPMEIRSQTFKVPEASIGRYTVLPNEMIFGQVDDLAISEGMVSGGRVSENFFYNGNASPESPEIGDIRISYSAYAADQFTTVFGEQQGDSVISWTDGESIIYRGYALDRQGGIDALRTEYLTALWGVRAASLAMFYIGLLMAVSPLTNILGYIPILGNVGKRVIAFATFVVAFVVWLITLIIAILLHNLIALIVVLAIVGGIGYFVWSKRNQEKSPEDLDYGTTG